MAVGDGVDQLISSAAALGSTTVDLNRKDLTEIPPGILDLQQLEFLYLEGNFLTTLPETLFERLPNLKWLDLRNNHIAQVPSTIGAHKSLKNLLLEGNNIRSLPLELGFTRSLSGLNISSNPLEDPPSHVIEKGTQEVLRYLRERFMERREPEGQEAEVRPLTPSSSEEDLPYNKDYASKEHDRTPRRYSTGASSSSRRNSLTHHSLEDPDLRPIHTPVSLHTPPSRPDVLRMQYDRRRMQSHSAGAADTWLKHAAAPSMDLSWGKAGSAGSVTSSKRREYMTKKPNPRLERLKYDIKDPPKFPDFEAKIAEQQNMAMNAALNEKENEIVQKRKDKKALDDWRDKTKRIRQRKQHLAQYKRPDKVDVNAPYGTENNMKEEKPNAMYVAKLKELLDDKDKTAARRAMMDRELEDRIRMHMDKIQDHRRKAYDNITDELESARRNLEMAHQFQRELEERRALEYRLRAFTGDDIALAKGKIRSPKKKR